MPAALRVLVVDNERLMRWSVGEVLRRSGHTVIEAADAHEARKAINETSEPIDVLLLDCRLPHRHALQLLEDVHRRAPRSAVVLMTAYGTPEMVQGALDRGAYCVLSKPFDMHTIAALVANAYQVSRCH